MLQDSSARAAEELAASMKVPSPGEQVPHTRPVVTAKRVGRTGALNAEFEELRRERGFNAARVLASPLVPDAVYIERINACMACEYATVMSDGAVFCECCACSGWRSDMREQNRHAANMCRCFYPAFYQYGPEGVYGEVN